MVFIGVAGRMKSLFRPEKPARDHPRKSFAIEKSNGRRNRLGKNVSTFDLGQFPPPRTVTASCGVHSSQMLFRPLGVAYLPVLLARSQGLVPPAPIRYA